MIRALVTILTVAVLLGACGGGGGSSGDGGHDEPEPTGWRSVLFPEDWTPATTDAEGRFLHDFSYAGYRNGEAPLPDVSVLTVHDVALLGGDPTGAMDSGPAIQAAIDAAEGGGIVYFPAGLYRCDRLLTIEASGVVFRGAGAEASRLFFTTHTGISDRSHLHFRGNLSHGPDRVLAVDGASRSPDVFLADVSGLVVGDDVAIGCLISDEFIAEHGMTGTWQAFNGTWQPFFRREIVAVDDSVSPARVTLDVPLRYPMKTRDAASLRVETGHLSEVGVEDLGLSNAAPWNDAWSNDRAASM